MNHQRGSIALWVIGLVLAMAVGTAVFVVPRSANGPVDNKLVAGEKIYRNDIYDFEFKYPKEWNIVATTSPYRYKQGREPQSSYLLFKAENVDLVRDKGDFLIYLDVFTRQNNKYVMVGSGGGGEIVLSYNFAEDNFIRFHESSSTTYTWESVGSDKYSLGTEYFMDTLEGLRVVRSLQDSPPPVTNTDTYFIVDGDKNSALLFVFQYSGHDAKSWTERVEVNDGRQMLAVNLQALRENKRVVETRNILENVIRSLVFYKK